jgi:hypothetical protein
LISLGFGLKSRRTIWLTRIVAKIYVFEAQRTDGGHLGHILTRLRPVKMGCVARQDDNAPGRKRIHLIAIKLIAEADVEDARNDR